MGVLSLLARSKHAGRRGLHHARAPKLPHPHPDRFHLPRPPHLQWQSGKRRQLFHSSGQPGRGRQDPRGARSTGARPGHASDFRGWAFGLRRFGPGRNRRSISSTRSPTFTCKIAQGNHRSGGRPRDRVAEAWKTECEASEYYRPPAQDPAIPSNPLRPMSCCARWVRGASLWPLVSRQWRILVSSRLNYLFSLLAQALVIGLLIAWVSENLVLQMFLALIATLWFGCSNGPAGRFRIGPSSAGNGWPGWGSIPISSANSFSTESLPDSRE